MASVGSQLKSLLQFFGILPITSVPLQQRSEEFSTLNREINFDNEDNEGHLDQYLYRDDMLSFSELKTPLTLSVHLERGAGSRGGDVVTYVYRNSAGDRLDVVFEDCPEMTRAAIRGG